MQFQPLLGSHVPRPCRDSPVDLLALGLLVQVRLRALLQNSCAEAAL